VNTAHVHVYLFAAAKAAVGASEVLTEPGTLSSILEAVAAQAPRFEGVRPQCSLLVDGIAIHGHPDTVLVEAGSRVDVLPPFAGG
jgi:molybdopterin converting factor small subunit